MDRAESSGADPELEMRTGPLVVIGPGSVGTALAIRCRRAGLAPRAVVGRSLDRARGAAERIGGGIPSTLDALAAACASNAPSWMLVTVRDDALCAVAEAAATAFERAGARIDGTIALHASGVHARDALAPLRRVGARVASVHPLRSFADPFRAAEDFDGTWCFHDEDPGITAAIVAWIEATGRWRCSTRRSG